MFGQLIAFLKKDFLSEASYRFAFLFTMLSVLTGVLAYFFIDRLFGRQIVPQLQEFGVNYFSYVLLGMTLFSFIGVGLGSFAGRIQTEQTQGTLEAILATPVSLSTMLAAMAIWNLLVCGVETTMYIVLGIFVFHIDFSRVNIVATMLLFFLTVTSFSSLGILSASFIVVFKRGNPASWIVNSVEALLGGVYFPTTILPQWLQTIAQFFPITHAVRAAQLAVYGGYTVAQLARELALLALFSVIVLPMSVLVFKAGIAKARREGTLLQF